MIISNSAAESVRLVRHFVAAYPVRSALMLLALTAAALAEGVAIGALLPLISLVIDAQGSGGMLTAYVAQVFDLVGLELSLGGLLVLIVVAITLKASLTLLAATQVGYSAAHVAMELRIECVRTLLQARWMHFVDRRAGELASVFSVQPTRAATAYIASCRVLSGAIQLLIHLALAIAISWEILVAAVVVGALTMVALSRLVGISRRAGQNLTKLQKSFMTRLLQAIDGMKPLKAMALEASTRLLIEGDIRGLNNALRTITVSREALTESHEIMRAFALAGGVYVFVTILGQPVEGLLVLALLFVRILQKVSRLQSCYQDVVTNLPAFGFVRATITTAERARERIFGGTVPRLNSAISLRDVSFSYGRGNVLDGVSITLPAGAFTAIVGSSGVGKTTIADLIIGLIRPQRGEVWIDELPMRNIDVHAWRGMIGYVPQETFLFHDTVMANVGLGEPGISRADVETALRRSEAWTFVAALPEGMDTVVGERGARLSGGERQRIAIARALVRDPALIILDEATSALDPETEEGILATIRRLVGGLTVLSISHRPAMRRAADLVYRLDNGGAATLGSTDEETTTAGRMAGLHPTA